MVVAKIPHIPIIVAQKISPHQAGDLLGHFLAVLTVLTVVAGTGDLIGHEAVASLPQFGVDPTVIPLVRDDRHLELKPAVELIAILQVEVEKLKKKVA